jgi:hypothetical protein
MSSYLDFASTLTFGTRFDSNRGIMNGEDSGSRSSTSHFDTNLVIGLLQRLGKGSFCEFEAEGIRSALDIPGVMNCCIFGAERHQFIVQ